jgi:flagellar hook-length control protein FliK
VYTEFKPLQDEPITGGRIEHPLENDHQPKSVVVKEGKQVDTTLPVQKPIINEGLESSFKSSVSVSETNDTKGSSAVPKPSFTQNPLQSTVSQQGGLERSNDRTGAIVRNQVIAADGGIQVLERSPIKDEAGSKQSASAVSTVLPAEPSEAKSQQQLQRPQGADTKPADQLSFTAGIRNEAGRPSSAGVKEKVVIPRPTSEAQANAGKSTGAPVARVPEAEENKPEFQRAAEFSEPKRPDKVDTNARLQPFPEVEEITPRESVPELIERFMPVRIISQRDSLSSQITSSSRAADPAPASPQIGERPVSTNGDVLIVKPEESIANPVPSTYPEEYRTRENSTQSADQPSTPIKQSLLAQKAEIHELGKVAKSSVHLTEVTPKPHNVEQQDGERSSQERETPAMPPKKENLQSATQGRNLNDHIELELVEKSKVAQTTDPAGQQQNEQSVKDKPVRPIPTIEEELQPSIPRRDSSQSVARPESTEKPEVAHAVPARSSHVEPGNQLMQLKVDVAVVKEHTMPHAVSDARLPEEVSKGLLEQVTKELSVWTNARGSEVKLHLVPESLGELVMKVKMEEGKMSAQIDVTQVNVKAALEANLPQLREALATRGIEVHRIEILAAGDAAARESRSQQEGKSKSNGKRRVTDAEAAQYQNAKWLGYNTMDFVI